MFKVRNKIHVIPTSIVIVCLIIISTFFGIYMMGYMRKDKLEDFQYATQCKSEEAVEFLCSIENDVTSLSNNLFLTNLIDAVKREDSEEINYCRFEVEMLFKTFSESRKIYDQIRYIDLTGREVVRVDIKGSNAYVVPQEELQDKRHRYYFQEAIKLDQDNIYISELDLNREEGQIEMPHKPMLRYAIPVFGSEKQVQGIVVLNVLADYLLNNILTREILKGVDTYLLDRDGYYLLHPEVTKQWGNQNDLNTGENIKSDFPQGTASPILSGQSGNRLIHKQFFNFIPIYFDPSDHKRYWIIAEGLDKSVVYSPIYTFIILLGIIISILIVGAVILSLTFLKRITNPLRELVKGTKQITAGDLEHTITIERKHNEIIELTEAFNQMVKKLRTSNEENRHLFLQVKQGRDQWQKTFDTITDLITIHDKDFRVIRANKAFLEKFNVSAEELADKKCYEIFHGTGEPWPTCPLVKTAESLQPECAEVDDPNMGGIFMVSTYPILDEQGNLNGVVHHAKDITLQKEAKKQLAEKADLLEMANRELEDFVYIVSHDLKEPLFTIEGYTSKLYRTYKDTYGDKGKRLTDSVRRNVQVMSQKIQEIMEVLKVGRIDYNFSNNDSGRIVHGVVNSLERRIKSNRVKVEIEQNLPTVFCDERRMKDVFSNLITNAIKFMGNSKQTENSHDQFNEEGDDGLRCVKIGCHADGNSYKFFVEDTGIGIRKEHREQIFKIFNRLRDIETEGTGVGLAIVKKIVELHSGKLWVESSVEDDRGSRFCFTIPKAR